MNKWAHVENVATLVCTTALVLGLYHMGAGGASLWGLILLGNLNYRPSNRQ